MALYHFTAKILSHSARNTVGAVAYRAGCHLSDLRTSESFNYENKAVQHVELALPKNAPQWIQELQELIKVDRQNGVQALCEKVEVAEYRINSQVWREIEVALHRELTNEQNITLAREFVQDQLCGRGMSALLNFHFDVDKETGDEKPHCHILLTMRTLEETGFNSKKERSWNEKALIQELREQWANYSNFHLKLNGHEVQIDHRSNVERGIDMEPQPKRGRGVIELEKRLQKLEGHIEKDTGDKTEQKEPLSPLTDRMRAFHDTQVRNLYRVIRNPDIILDIVSKHHSTFMWADVQKKLHQYVDDSPLFNRLEAKLHNSHELVLLRMEEVRDFSGIPHEEAIYTTRSMLKAELSLMEQAEELGKSKTHGVQQKYIEVAFAKANENLKEHGSLSEDQVKAIHHLVDRGQIKCVVGIAGAGKTTAIGVCHEIWKAEGYAVYGLAPTGKASQNLEGSSLDDNSLESGIPSTTLHKFLKSFEEGRCQYKSKSVLVLDEAGMVNVERFEKLLVAVRKLGVKLIIVGDGAQLQPVEAGPAFRLVTEKLGRAELNTVIRQKETWQKEATVLFGQQKTREAIQKYADNGCVHIVEEKLPLLDDVLKNKDYEGLVHLYEVSHRVSSLIYREMARDVQKQCPELKNLYPRIKEHEDFSKYLHWKDRERDAAGVILQKASLCLPALEARRIDTLKLALVLKDKGKDKFIQQEEAKALLKKCGLDHLIGMEKEPGLSPGLRPWKSVDVRKTVKQELIQAWHQDYKEDPSKGSAILAFSNRDMNDLNRQARAILKESGHLSKEEFTFTIKKEIEDDFDRKFILQEKKGFSKGDRIVFTKNKSWSRIRNGTMGTITELNAQKIQVKLDEGKEISFAPNLNPYFDQGWAVTIHKSQGTTVDKTYVLGSYEMNQNLAYVAMTRHREAVNLFGSSLDFWRAYKLPEVLSKSGEKLSAADYLDAEALTKIMKQDDQLITKFLSRMSGELEAMGVVSKQAFWSVADHFLGIKREKEIRVFQDSIREEVRAEKLFKKEAPIVGANEPLKGTPPEGTHSPESPHSSAFIKIPGHVIKNSEKEDSLSLDSQSLGSSGLDSKGLDPNGFVTERDPHRGSYQKTEKEKTIAKEAVESALKENMGDFANHVFASTGADYNRAMSSRTERRYGTKGEFSVNLQKGLWCSYKDAQLAGGPLHLLTQLKNLSFKEAIDYGASWARLSPEQLLTQKQPIDSAYSQKMEKETLEKEAAENKQKIERAQKLWAKGQSIHGTIAEHYLKEHRKIEGDWPQDIRYLPNVKVAGEQNTGKAYPCLMVAARSATGDVTAVQLTFLDPTTAHKADIPVQKRSYGLLKGSAVTIQAGKACPLERGGDPENTSLLFIAEGVETALSLKVAGIEGTIKASLGLSNIARLEPQDSKAHIVICGDHDAPDSPAAKSLNKSVVVLQEKGFKVTIIKPDIPGEDFNDVLKKKGPEGIKEVFAKQLPEGLGTAIQIHSQTLPLPENLPQRESDTSEPLQKEEKYSLNNENPQEFTLAGKSFQEIKNHCEKRLHDSLARDKNPLTQEHIKRFPLQAEKTASFILHTHGLDGRAPTEEEFLQLALRAKYELRRIPEIRRDLIEDWQDRDSFKESEGLLAHMIAERLASIEGRLYLKAKQQGFKVPSNIAELAQQELKEHRAETPKLAQELSQKHALSKDTATNSAKDILRYKEIHGPLPSDSQVANMIQIAKKVGINDHSLPSSKKLNSVEKNYLQRHEGDLLFKHMSCQKGESSGAHLLHIQEQAKKSLEAVSSQIVQELIKMNQKEFSM